MGQLQINHCDPLYPGYIDIIGTTADGPVASSLLADTQWPPADVTWPVPQIVSAEQLGTTGPPMPPVT